MAASALSRFGNLAWPGPLKTCKPEDSVIAPSAASTARNPPHLLLVHCRSPSIAVRLLSQGLAPAAHPPSDRHPAFEAAVSAPFFDGCRHGFHGEQCRRQDLPRPEIKVGNPAVRAPPNNPGTMKSAAKPHTVSARTWTPHIEVLPLPTAGFANVPQSPPPASSPPTTQTSSSASRSSSMAATPASASAASTPSTASSTSRATMPARRRPASPHTCAPSCAATTPPP